MFCLKDYKGCAKRPSNKKKVIFIVYSQKYMYLCRVYGLAMKDKLFWIRTIAYCIIFFGVWIGMAIFPPIGGYIWDAWVINISTSLFFTLLVALTAQLARTDRTILGIIATATFLIFFCPGEEAFFTRDESALSELSAQCIVPFFISQYTRVSQKDFHRWYLLMLLMGIFCSYTHNGITIPLCCAFVWLAFQRRERFFRQACWPMVIGVIIGTGLSIWQKRNDSLNMATDLETITSVTNIALKTLWDTKVFMLSIILTGYVYSMKKGRRQLEHVAQRHYVIALCSIFSLCTLPFAPLGIENAVTGVCFFSMYWVLFLCHHLVRKWNINKYYKSISLTFKKQNYETV